MKHFRIIGPKTTREFDIEDNEMIVWNIIKESDFEKEMPIVKLAELTQPMQNENIYTTKDGENRHE